MSAVSYTHLDVYKRQCQYSSAAIDKRKMQNIIETGLKLAAKGLVILFMTVEKPIQ